jgi:hypothetical protein
MRNYIHSKRLTPKSMAAAWGSLAVAGGSFTYFDGMHFIAAAVAGTSVQITMTHEMADTNYCVLVTARNYAHFFIAAPTTKQTFLVTAYDAAGAVVDPFSLATSFNFLVFAKQ